MASGGRCVVSDYDPAGTAEVAVLFLLLASCLVLFAVAWGLMLDSARAILRRRHDR
jgi:hypothetical protein